jgi:hypothetical protein
MTQNYPILSDIDEDYADYLLQLNQEDDNIRFVAIMNIADEEQPELLAWLHHAVWVAFLYSGFHVRSRVCKPKGP